MDRGAWPALKEKVAAVIKTKTRDEWDALMEGTDVCYAPVLDMDEAASHPHNLARETLVERDGVTQPNVAPRFSRTQSEIQGPPPEIGAHNDTALMPGALMKRSSRALNLLKQFNYISMA